MRHFLLATVFIVLANAANVCAAQLRYRYVPVDAQGNTTMQPDASGAPGERISFFAGGRQPTCSQPRPTCIQTFRHPCTGQPVSVPLALPQDTPVIEHVRNRVVYNYGSYTVEVRFLPDGSVEVVYNSGFLRGI